MSNRPRPEYCFLFTGGYSANAVEVLGCETPDTSVAEVEVYSPVTCAYTKNYYDRIFIESNLKSNKLMHGSRMLPCFTTSTTPLIISLQLLSISIIIIFLRHVLPFQSLSQCSNSFTHVRGSLWTTLPKRLGPYTELINIHAAERREYIEVGY